MRGRSLTIAGTLAVIALAIRALLDWDSGTSLPLLFIAAALGTALLLRPRYPRE